MSDDLFGWPGPGARPTDPSTSHEAAGATPALRAQDRRQVLLLHASHPDGLTDFELAAIADRQQTSFGKRRGELRDAGYIEETPLRRAAPSGASAIVWRITDDGLGVACRLGFGRLASISRKGALWLLQREKGKAMAHDSRKGGAVGGAKSHRGEVPRGGGAGHGSEGRRDVPRESRASTGTSEASRAELQPGRPATPEAANALRAPGAESRKENRPGDRG